VEHGVWGVTEHNPELGITFHCSPRAYIDESFIQWHVDHCFAAFPYLTQANGYFRRLEQNTLDRVPPDARVRTLFDHDENRKRFKRVRHLQQKYNLSVGQVVLGYLTGQPFPVFPLVGPKTLGDLQDSLHSVETRLSEADISFLEGGGEPDSGPSSGGLK
jgi:aryl-alcohol dehydrogenase-like predicted oxidoreductase